MNNPLTTAAVTIVVCVVIYRVAMWDREGEPVFYQMNVSLLLLYIAGVAVFYFGNHSTVISNILTVVTFIGIPLAWAFFLYHCLTYKPPEPTPPAQEPSPEAPPPPSDTRNLEEKIAEMLKENRK